MRRITIKHLETVVAVAGNGTIAAAAEVLNVTAAALTSRIKLLEDDAGVAMFDRTGGRLRLTEAGQEVVNIATRIDLALAELKATLTSHKEKNAGRVTIGVASTAKYFAPRLIASFARGHPRVEIAVTVGNRASIVAALREQSVDLALMGTPPADAPIESEVFGLHPHVIIAPPDHCMVKRVGIDRGDLRHESFIIREEGSGTRNNFGAFFEGLTLQSSRVHIEIGSNETVKQAVMAGLGITLISAHTIEAEVAENRLAILDVIGMPIMRQWHVVRQISREPSGAAASLWDFIRTDGRGFLPKVALPVK